MAFEVLTYGDPAADTLLIQMVDDHDLEVIEIAETEAEDMVLEADVVIVGAGGAGLTAAVTACKAGSSVIVLE